MASLLDILSYKREILTQLLLVATILGAFSMSGVVAILVGPSRDRLHQFLFSMLCVASLTFIFATALDAVLLPATGRKANVNLAPERIRTLLTLCDMVVWTVIVGALSLVTAIAGFGFVFSRRLGYLICGIATAVVIVLFWTFRALSHALA
ncbi:MAG TPA: hypothetical protein DCM86_03040 [Verrucomicrobiales bacterium]|nr:hypothetical protein [Verrucomicrobiales bacterium]